MEMVFMFVTILAWIFLVLEGLLLVVKILSAVTYSEMDKLRDQLKGFTRSWPIGKNLVIFFICLAWILARWLT